MILFGNKNKKSPRAAVIEQADKGEKSCLFFKDFDHKWKSILLVKGTIRKLTERYKVETNNNNSLLCFSHCSGIFIFFWFRTTV